MKTPPNKRPSLNKYAKYSAFAFQFVAVFVLLSLGGNWLDGRLRYKFPLFTLIGVFVALIAIFYSLYTLITKRNNDNDPN